MKPKKTKMKKNTLGLIRLFCQYRGSPAHNWDAEVEFRRLASGGYSVWARNDEQWCWAKLHHSNEKLTWKSAAYVLLKVEGLGIGIDMDGVLLPKIQVEGAPEWAADVLRICWGTFHRPKEVRKLFLLSLKDSDIESIWRHCSSLCNTEALDLLSRLTVLFTQSGLGEMGDNERDLAEIAREIGFPYAKGDSISGLVGALEQFVLNNGIELFLVRKQSDFIVGSDILKELMSFPSPQSENLTNRLLHSWIVAERKPTGGNLRPGFSVSSSELPFLQWVLGQAVNQTLASYHKVYPDEARVLVAWIHNRGRQAAWSLENFGPGMGGAMGVGYHQYWVKFARHVEESAKEAGIPLEETS